MLYSSENPSSRGSNPVNGYSGWSRFIQLLLQAPQLLANYRIGCSPSREVPSQVGHALRARHPEHYRHFRMGRRPPTPRSARDQPTPLAPDSGSRDALAPRDRHHPRRRPRHLPERAGPWTSCDSRRRWRRGSPRTIALTRSINAPLRRIHPWYDSVQGDSGGSDNPAVTYRR
jgi:hypothetical protein